MSEIKLSSGADVRGSSVTSTSSRIRRVGTLGLEGIVSVFDLPKGNDVQLLKGGGIGRNDGVEEGIRKRRGKLGGGGGCLHVPAIVIFLFLGKGRRLEGVEVYLLLESFSRYK
jgi:hypothetical protein